ncbi:hypothetical protein [Lysobacter gummosus]|uniref:hypothetical protein n=1 Tax=Lysobacter gummosus TaxID=262324 RepID=UPI00363E8701
MGLRTAETKASGLKPLPQKTTRLRNLLWEGLQPRCLFHQATPIPTSTGEPDESHSSAINSSASIKTAQPRSLLWGFSPDAFRSNQADPDPPKGEPGRKPWSCNQFQDFFTISSLRQVPALHSRTRSRRYSPRSRLTR